MCVWWFWAEDMTNTATGVNFYTTAALPNSKTQLQIFSTPNSHFLVVSAQVLEVALFDGEQAACHCWWFNWRFFKISKIFLQFTTSFLPWPGFLIFESSLPSKYHTPVEYPSLNTLRRTQFDGKRVLVDIFNHRRLYACLIFSDSAHHWLYRVQKVAQALQAWNSCKTRPLTSYNGIHSANRETPKHRQEQLQLQLASPRIQP